MTVEADAAATRSSPGSDPRGTLPGLLAALLLGSGLVAAAMPTLFRVVPHDLRRVVHLLQALRTPDPRLTAVVLGNSVGMAGVDARALRPAPEVAWNLCSSDQTPAESLLLEQALPPTVRTVVQLVSPWQLFASRELDPERLDAYLVSGLRPEPETREALLRASPAFAPFLSSTELARRVRLRWIFGQALESVALRAAAPHGWRRRLETDLYHPIGGGQLGEPVGYLREGEGVALSAEHLRLVSSLVRAAHSHRRRLLLVASPLRGDLWSESQLEGFRRALGSSCADGGCRLLDATTLLAPARFTDRSHPDLEGARRLTALLASALAERG